jgi:hypothetical protein
MAHSEAIRAGRAARVIPWLLCLLGAAVSSPYAAPLVSIDEIRFVMSGEPPQHRPVFSEKKIRGFLKDHLGSECDPAPIRESLERRYRFLGYVPTVRVRCDAGGLTVTIRESSHRIELIAFDTEELTRIGVSPDPFFEDKVLLYAVPTGASRTLLKGLLRTQEGDLYNAERYRSDSEAVSFVGYVVAFIPGPETGPDSYPAGAYLVQSRVPRLEDGPPPDARTNYIGGLASYNPRAQGNVGVIYQKQRVFGQFDRFALSTYYGQELGGDLTYAAPILSDREDPKRLYDVGVSVFSNFRHNRLISGVETDERRSGAGLSWGLRPLGIRSPHDLRFRWALEHTRIDLEEDIPTVEEVDLTVLRWSAAYEWRHTSRSPSLSARLVPVLEFAFDSIGGAQTFVRGSLDASLHGRAMSGYEMNLHLTAGTMDRVVPEYELWDLGGATTVRGFRDDTLLGRHRVALQSELWIPFVRPLPYRQVTPGTPIPEPGDAPLEPRAARLLKAALFVDVGYLSGTLDGRNETLVGAGVGLRFVVPRRPLFFRLDYGWGLGDQGGDAFPYFSLGYRF